jgi:hypothetical protein
MATLLILIVGLSIGLTLGLFSFLLAWAVISIVAFAGGLGEGYLHSFAYAGKAELILTVGFSLGLACSWLWDIASARFREWSHARYRRTQDRIASSADLSRLR